MLWCIAPVRPRRLPPAGFVQPARPLLTSTPRSGTEFGLRKRRLLLSPTNFGSLISIRGNVSNAPTLVPQEGRYRERPPSGGILRSVRRAVLGSGERERG
jgi:hypothetical protein